MDWEDAQPGDWDVVIEENDDLPDPEASEEPAGLRIEFEVQGETASWGRRRCHAPHG